MSGLEAPTAIALGSLALQAGALGASVAQGESARRAGRRGEERQRQAQQQATARAGAEDRRREQELRRTQKRRPDTISLLERERRGRGSTSLTGAGGVPTNRLSLGQPSLLGG